MSYSLSFTALPEPDPLEPIREELRDAQSNRDKFMVATYALVGLIGFFLLMTIFTMFKCNKYQKELEGRLLQQGVEGE